MLVPRRLAWLLFLMALPGLLLAMRVRSWRKERARLACRDQIAYLQALPVSEGVTKRDTLLRALGSLRKKEGDQWIRAARRCRKRLILLPDEESLACLKHGLPVPPAGADPVRPGWMDSTTGLGASPRRQLELAGIRDPDLLERASDRPTRPDRPRRACRHDCDDRRGWLLFILGAALGYAWVLLRALKALVAAILGWPAPFDRQGASTPSTCADGVPPLIGT